MTYATVSLEQDPKRQMLTLTSGEVSFLLDSGSRKETRWIMAAM